MPQTNLSKEEILKSKKWSLYKTREIILHQFLDSIITDTIVYYENCYANSFFEFNKDSIVKRNFICTTPQALLEGKWYIQNDSIFQAPIYIRASYGTGSILTNMGIPKSKILKLTQKEFEVKGEPLLTFYPGRHFLHYYLKAVE